MLGFYKGSPLNEANLLDPVELFTGDGTTTTFTLTRFSGIRVASTIQVGSLFFTRSSIPAGFTVDGNDVTLLSPPANGATVIVPGISAASLEAFDTATAGTSTNANIDEEIFYIGDPDSIAFWKYKALPGNTGIVVSITDNFSTGGAEADWIQFAPVDGDGNPGTYLAAGAEIELGTLEAEDELQDSILAGATSIEVADGSQFTEGHLIQLGPGTAEQETRRIVSIAGNVLTITGTDFAHPAGELVYENAIPFAVKLTVPLDITEGQAMTLHDLGLTRAVRWQSRM
jgi:hypothetical protein